MKEHETPPPDQRTNPYRAPNTVADPPVEGLEDAAVRKRRRMTLLVIAVFLVPIASAIAFFCCYLVTFAILGDSIIDYHNAIGGGGIGAAATGLGLILFFARKIRRIG